MDYKDVIVDENISIRDALNKLDLSAHKVIFITDHDELIGAVSDGDIRRWILKGGSLDERVHTIMNRSPIYMTEANYEMAEAQMHNLGITAIPLLNRKKQIIDVYFWRPEEKKTYKEITADVVIMAGGKGERLMPYTSIVPKPLIPINEKPIIEHIIDSFVKNGCSNFFFTINYKKNMIKAYFDELERLYHISYIEEKEPLGTGGSLGYLKGKMTAPFFVSNCDILLDVDYSKVVDFHNKNKNLITVITSLKNIVLPYGVVNLNSKGDISDLIEKPAKDYLINTGVYLLEPKALEYLIEDEFTHITQLIEKCLDHNEKIGAFPISEDAWLDMGQFEDMEKMKKRLMVKRP